MNRMGYTSHVVNLPKTTRNSYKQWHGVKLPKTRKASGSQVLGQVFSALRDLNQVILEVALQKKLSPSVIGVLPFTYAAIDSVLI